MTKTCASRGTRNTVRSWDAFIEREKDQFTCYRPWLSKDKADDPGYKKLNLGSGTAILKPDRGWVNLDLYPDEDVVCHDITKLPFPFKDDEFDYILMSHILEHIPHTVQGYSDNFMSALIDELLRISRPGCIWEVHGPDPRDILFALGNPSHVRVVSPHTFSISVENGELERLDHTIHKWPVGRTIHFLGLTEWHFKKYLGRRSAEIAGRLVGRPIVLRMVFRVIG